MAEDKITPAINQRLNEAFANSPDKGDVTDFFTGEPIQQSPSNATSGQFVSPSSPVSSTTSRRSVSSGGGGINTPPPSNSRGLSRTPKGGRGIDAAFDIVFEELDEIRLELVEYIFPRVVINTPFDTGRARKGWAVSNKPGGIPSVPAGKYPAFQGARPFVKDIPDGIHKGPKTVVIGNSIDYINDLNNGTSPQAAAFYVDRIVGDAVNHVERFD